MNEESETRKEQGPQPATGAPQPTPQPAAWQRPPQAVVRPPKSAESSLESWNVRLRTSLFLKFCLIGAILLVCQIPMLMIFGLTNSRSSLATSVVDEVASKWGRSQDVAGPLLAIPMSRKWTERDKDGIITAHTEQATMFVVPESMKVAATLKPETRYRGIYEVILYHAELEIEGVFSESFTPPSESLEGWKVDYTNARICLGITDMIGLATIRVETDGAEARANPGIEVSYAPFDSGVSIPVSFPMPKDGLKFKATISLNGCRALRFVPIGRNNEIKMDSPWETPSFDGNFLPTQREIGNGGFKATWNINEFNRNIPQTWVSRSSHLSSALPTAGVSLIKQADVYAQVSRAATYSILIFLIVLISFLIAERLTKVWMHPLQYLLAALSLVLFYALTLSLSEHIAFNASYWLSVVIICGLCVFYCSLIFRKIGAVLGMAAAMLASYGIIFVLLKLEDYALLAGVFTMLALLAILMGLTGRINK